MGFYQTKYEICLNGVKSMKTNSSPGKEQHVSTERHPATVSIKRVKGRKLLGSDRFPCKERQVPTDSHPPSNE